MTTKHRTKEMQEPKYLHRYVNEFSFRHNTANVGTMDFISMTVEKMQNRRLTYKELTHA